MPVEMTGQFPIGKLEIPTKNDKMQCNQNHFMITQFIVLINLQSDQLMKWIINLDLYVYFDINVD